MMKIQIQDDSTNEKMPIDIEPGPPASGEVHITFWGEPNAEISFAAENPPRKILGQMACLNVNEMLIALEAIKKLNDLDPEP